jgi:cellulose synthase/poly-beta-1,6-N-acetylglucosamine synthase-like glycosyltransferase
LITYALAVLLLRIGWQKAISRTHETLPQSATPLLSVIIPFRNEEDHLYTLVSSLSHQSYKNFELILVDDHSTNPLFDPLALEKIKGRLILSNGKGKKAAITSGVKIANGVIIVTTDADCIVPGDWLERINKKFHSDDVQFVFGGVKFKQNGTLFLDMQAIEFASLIGSAAATAEFGFPTMCNGANLAYRKETFELVKGYEGNENIPSGDDEFLMRKILKLKPGSARFLGVEGVVVTDAKKLLSDFFTQRIRWAAKWSHNSAISTVAIAMFVTIFQVLWLFQLYSLVREPGNILIILTVVTKILAEYSFLKVVCARLRIRWSLAAFLLLQAVYPLYVIVIAVASNFVSYSWKGRKIR